LHQKIVLELVGNWVALLVARCSSLVEVVRIVDLVVVPERLMGGTVEDTLNSSTTYLVH
jgi:hypothetical protein